MNIAASTLIVIAVVGVALWFGIRWFVRSRSKYGGTKVVTCPETKEPAIVEVDSLYTSLTSATRFPDIRLEHCSRWPMKEECGQECLMDLDVAPENCLVSGVLMRWYRDRHCVFCQKDFPELHWIDHRPALRSPDGKLLAWNEVHLNDLRNVLETHSAVCWDCYITQSFRVEHPDLVVFRPWRNDGSRGGDDTSTSRHA
ncbi:MAG TPA: hypothetical protein VFZ22_23955 [Pyrinomonadaceae bacterium]|nr:hypothetical protein [Pyrinomonadaceae bacterium]